MVGTPLSRWLSVPPTYDGLLLDTRKTGGALKRRAADIKIGPLLHASGQHYDGDKVKVAVQVGRAGVGVWGAGKEGWCGSCCAPLFLPSSSPFQAVCG